MTFNIKHLIELGIHIYLFIILNQYGIGKIIGQQFYRKGKLPESVANIRLGNVEAFDLAWTFMGYSFYYILFVGLSQIIGSWLLLFNKTKLLGVIVLIPIVLNIVVFDIIFLNAYGALASATLYLSLLIIVLFLNKNRVIKALKTLTTKSKKQITLKTTSLAHLGMLILIIAFIFGFDQLCINLLGHGKG